VFARALHLVITFGNSDSLGKGEATVKSSEAAAWAAAAVTFLAVIVALFRNELRALWRRPRMSLQASLAPPDCHKTEVRVTDLTGRVIVGPSPCYYLRVWVENVGNLRAEQVQVFVSRLLRRHADGNFREEPQFLPMNLKWSHTGEVFAPGLSPKMGKHCDVAHVVHPSGTATVGHALSAVQAGNTVACLNLEVPPSTRSHLLSPGAYRLELRIAASNMLPLVRMIELTHTGVWFDDETRMFSDGLGFHVVS
jgi:hypothetical protein